MKKGLVLMMFLMTGSAFAGNYAGVRYAMTSYDETGVPTASPSAIVGIFGHNFSSSFAMEARFGLGIQSDTVNVSGIDVDLEIDNFISVLAKGSVEIDKNARVFGLVGFTDGSVTASALGQSFTGSENDLSYGAGIEFGTGKTTGVLEYISYINKSGASLSSINLGANFAF